MERTDLPTCIQVLTRCLKYKQTEVINKIALILILLKTIIPREFVWPDRDLPNPTRLPPLAAAVPYYSAAGIDPPPPHLSPIGAAAADISPQWIPSAFTLSLTICPFSSPPALLSAASLPHRRGGSQIRRLDQIILDILLSLLSTTSVKWIGREIHTWIGGEHGQGRMGGVAVSRDVGGKASGQDALEML